MQGERERGLVHSCDICAWKVCFCFSLFLLLFLSFSFLLLFFVRVFFGEPVKEKEPREGERIEYA